MLLQAYGDSSTMLEVQPFRNKPKILERLEAEHKASHPKKFTAIRRPYYP